MDYKKELFCTLYVDNLYDSFIEIWKSQLKIAQKIMIELVLTFFCLYLSKKSQNYC